MNTSAITALFGAALCRVVVSNPHKTRAIAEAKVKTDKVDARVLAELLAADYLPSVWLADDDTRALRRQVSRWVHLVRHRTRLKNQVQAVLARNLLPRCPAADLFGRKGRAWLAAQPLPVDEASTVAALLRQLDFAGEELGLLDGDLARVALERADAGEQPWLVASARWPGSTATPNRRVCARGRRPVSRSSAPATFDARPLGARRRRYS